jgi:hypothetical protein
MMETADNSAGASVQVAKWSRNSLGKEERFYSQMRSVGDCRMDMWSASQRRFSRVLKDDFWVAHGSLVVRAWLTRIIFASCRASRSMKRIADSQTKN